jgi:DNA-directed RNA polymerase subunit RPC12/RpoP
MKEGAGYQWRFPAHCRIPGVLQIVEVSGKKGKKMRTTIYQCLSCGWRNVDTGPDEELPQEQFCPKCGYFIIKLKDDSNDEHHVIPDDFGKEMQKS